jgi:hypothetical protein
MSQKIHIGLDFGTYQSKACVYHIENDSREFYKFKKSNSFFIPSSITIDRDGFLRFGGATSQKEGEKHYRYFKIAAAEDKAFRLETFEQEEDSNFYRFNEFQDYSPEVLSVIYLTYLIVELEETLRPRFEGTKNTGGALLRGLFQRQQKTEDVSFTYRLGIPTEWSQKKTIERKRKFENILLLARLLSKKYGSTKELSLVKIVELLSALKDLNLNQQIGSLDAFKERLNNEGVSVYPETAAGLALITHEKLVTPGCYATMDIGGGSTDISFFRVFSDYKIIYFASETYLLACNNIYLDYLGNSANTISELEATEKEVIELLQSPKWDQNSSLLDAIDKVNGDLREKLSKLFVRRVLNIQQGFRHEFNDKEIIIYGGGSTMPILKKGSPVIFDNGLGELAGTPTRMHKRPIGDFASNLETAGNDSSWKEHLNLLVVALGLSYLNPDLDGDDWIDDSIYMPSDDGPTPLQRHPFNEDCYIYNVYSSTWD